MASDPLPSAQSHHYHDYNPPMTSFSNWGEPAPHPSSKARTPKVVSWHLRQPVLPASGHLLSQMHSWLPPDPPQAQVLPWGSLRGRSVQSMFLSTGVILSFSILGCLATSVDPVNGERREPLPPATINAAELGMHQAASKTAAAVQP